MEKINCSSQVLPLMVSGFKLIHIDKRNSRIYFGLVCSCGEIIEVRNDILKKRKSSVCNKCVNELILERKRIEDELLKRERQIRKINSSEKFPTSSRGLIAFYNIRNPKNPKYRVYGVFCVYCKKISEVSSFYFKNSTGHGCGKCIGEHYIEGDFAYIPVKINGVSPSNLVIDKINLPLIMSYNKSISAYCSGRSAYATFSHTFKNNSVHRIIMNAKDGEFVDHFDGNGLNCVISNMSIVTKQENGRNIPLMSRNTSGIMGVCKKRKRWRAYITIDGKQLNLGHFQDFFSACCARKSAERRFNFSMNHGRESNSLEEVVVKARRTMLN